MSVVQKSSLLPVTALKYVKLGEEEILVAGEGPKLKAFSKTGLLLSSVEVLPFKALHGIRPVQHNASTMLLVFGQKSYRVVQLRRNGGLSLECVSPSSELDDWIVDAICLEWLDPSHHKLAFITAHNVLLIYSVVRGKVTSVQYHCEISCILYSGLLSRDTVGDLAVISGTVFNKILLWHVSDISDAFQGQRSPIIVRVTFTGHKGVIFSVKTNKDFSKVVSASDDRTVCVWAIPDDWKSQQRDVVSDCLLVLYGHTARVWSAMLLPNTILSIGEDATCRVWSYGGQCLKTLHGHKGKSIWSMAVDSRQEVVATGGGDCSIRLHSLNEPTEPAVFHSWEPCHHDGDTITPSPPRSVFLLGHTAICLTDHGRLFAGQWSGKMTWSEVAFDPQFSGYSVGGLSSSGSQILALGSLQGAIKLMKLDEKGCVSESVLWQAYHGKVFSLTWTQSRGVAVGRDLLFSCGPDGQIIGWEVKEDTLETGKLVTLTLPASKHRWITTVSVLTPEVCPPSLPSSSPSSSASPSPVVLVGDRKGSLHLYKLEEGVCAPHQTLPGSHGPNGVTYSCSHGSAVYSCGRNGLCRKFQLCYSPNGLGELQELTVLKLVKGLEWIERIHFTEDGDVLVLGFHGANLVLHSTAQNRRILSVACGGGHRSCAVSPPQEMLARKKASVLFIRKAEVIYSEVELREYFTQPLVQPAFVGLEASSMVLVRSSSENEALVAVGSEDCSICLLKVQAERGTSVLTVRHTLQGHISSVKALSSSGDCLLFSGGARARLKVWHVGEKEELCFETELHVHQDLGGKRKKRAKFTPLDPDVTPECRVMSLTSFPLEQLHLAPPLAPPLSLSTCHYVAAGCSDALIRQYIYDVTEKTFHCLSSLKTNERCVITVTHFFIPRSVPKGTKDSSPAAYYPILCSTSTDGVIAVWQLLSILTDYLTNTQQRSSQSVAPLLTHKSHQSGINALTVQQCFTSEEGVWHHAVVSGGEDNALAVIYLLSEDVGGSLSVQVAKHHTHPTAHSSTITGLCFIADGLVMSTSIDQRLNIWRVSQESGFQLMSSHTHDVADPSSLLAYTHSELDSVLALFCGVGLQCYMYNKDDL